VAFLRYTLFFSLRLPAFLAVVLILTGSQSFAQSVENISTRFDGQNIIITYDLVHSNVNEKFRVDLFSSHDNYNLPLKLVTGAAGDNVTPGRGNQVIWDAKSTLPADFDDEISIRIRITKMRVAMAMNPLKATAYKRGRTVTLSWTGGAPDDRLLLQLYQNNVLKMSVDENVGNTGAYSWRMPKNIKGKGYSLRLSAKAGPEETTATNNFRVKPSTPFIVKALPVIAAGVVVMLISGQDDGGGGGGTPSGDSVLPSPQRPGGG